jgi:biotin carboxyl carrier protein
VSKIAVTIDRRTFEVEFGPGPRCVDALAVAVDGEAVAIRLPDWDKPVDEMEWIIIGGRVYEVAFDRDLHWIKAFSGIHQLDVRDLQAAAPRPLSGDGRVKAPIPGQIARVLVEVGQAVEAGQPVLVLEAMKMENEIRAPRPGRVSAVHVAAGEAVVLHQLLAEVA